MDSGTWLHVALVQVFVLVGGNFAGTEFALVSLRDSQIEDPALALGKGLVRDDQVRQVLLGGRAPDGEC